MLLRRFVATYRKLHLLHFRSCFRSCSRRLKVTTTMSDKTGDNGAAAVTPPPSTKRDDAVAVTPPPSKKHRTELALTPPCEVEEPTPEYQRHFFRRLWRALEIAQQYSSDEETP